MLVLFVFIVLFRISRKAAFAIGHLYLWLRLWREWIIVELFDTKAPFSLTFLFCRSTIVEPAMQQITRKRTGRRDGTLDKHFALNALRYSKFVQNWMK